MCRLINNKFTHWNYSEHKIFYFTFQKFQQRVANKFLKLHRVHKIQTNPNYFRQ